MHQNYGNISIKKKTRDRINEIRRPRLETYDDTINRLLDNYKEETENA